MAVRDLASDHTFDAGGATVENGDTLEDACRHNPSTGSNRAPVVFRTVNVTSPGQH